MSEAKREVWVVEQDDGQPLAAYIGKRAESYARLWQDDNAFRYVPESAQPAERAGAWVSVEERLPKPDRNVLVSEKGDEPYKAYYDGDEWFSLDSAFPRSQVTHWMPLPPPPHPKGET